jgi:hypothetical protein
LPEKGNDVIVTYEGRGKETGNHKSPMPVPQTGTPPLRDTGNDVIVTHEGRGVKER